MLKGYEPWKYKVAWELFPSPNPNKAGNLSTLGKYLWTAIEGISLPQRKSEMWKLKEELNEIRENLSIEEIQEGFKILVNAYCKNADPSAIKDMQDRFDQLLSIDPEIPYRAVEF